MPHHLSLHGTANLYAYVQTIIKIVKTSQKRDCNIKVESQTTNGVLPCQN